MSCTLRDIDERRPSHEQLLRGAVLEVVEAAYLCDMQHVRYSIVPEALQAAAGRANGKPGSANVSGARHMEQTQVAHSGLFCS